MRQPPNIPMLAVAAGNRERVCSGSWFSGCGRRRTCAISWAWSARHPQRGWVWPASLVALAINVLGLVSLYGFAFGKRVGGHRLAVAMFVLNVAAQVFAIYIGHALFAALFDLPVRLDGSARGAGVDGRGTGDLALSDLCLCVPHPRHLVDQRIKKRAPGGARFLVAMTQWIRTCSARSAWPTSATPRGSGHRNRRRTPAASAAGSCRSGRSAGCTRTGPGRSRRRS